MLVAALVVSIRLTVSTLSHLQQTKSPRKPASVKDDSFFGAFQGLSLDELLVSSRSSAAAGDQCKVMSHLTARQSNGPQETERTDSSQRKGRGSHLNPGRGDKANIFVCLCFFQLILIVHDGCLALNSVATCENGICWYWVNLWHFDLEWLPFYWSGVLTPGLFFLVESFKIQKQKLKGILFNINIKVCAADTSQIPLLTAS